VSAVQKRRRLIWIPIIHTETDLGSLYEPIKRLSIRKAGARAWTQRAKAVDQMWATIREAIGGLNLNHETVRLYQDGLPTCGREAEIVRQIAEAGSVNHQILVDLMERGATVTGTESPKLLLEEYELVRQHVKSSGRVGGGGSAQRLRRLSKEMLDKRDRYIARRISRTLRTGETGLIFLGLLHSLRRRLPGDIQVTLLGPASHLVR
jgi:hypothetical protein